MAAMRLFEGLQGESQQQKPFIPRLEGALQSFSPAEHNPLFPYFLALRRRARPQYEIFLEETCWGDKSWEKKADGSPLPSG